MFLFFLLARIRHLASNGRHQNKKASTNVNYQNKASGVKKTSFKNKGLNKTNHININKTAPVGNKKIIRKVAVTGYTLGNVTTDYSGNPLHSLSEYFRGEADYVSVAVDPKLIPLGTKFTINGYKNKKGKIITFYACVKSTKYSGRHIEILCSSVKQASRITRKNRIIKLL